MRAGQRFFSQLAASGFYSVASPDSAGLDLAVLTLCNHIVRSRGTFGLWGAILAGQSHVTITASESPVQGPAPSPPNIISVL